MTHRRTSNPIVRSGVRVSHMAAGLLAVGLLSIAVFGALAGSAGASSGSGSDKAEMAQAHKALLVLSDMPAGWTKTKSSNNSNTTVGNTQLAHCIGVATSLISENPPSVNSPEFENNKNGTLTVNDSVTIFPSTKNAEAEYATITNPKTPGCMTTLASGPDKQQLFGKTPKGTSIGTPLVSATAPGAFGRATGYSLSVPVTSQGVTINVTITELFAVKGRLGQQVTFSSFGAPFSITLERHLTSVAVERL
jgi:hypothetical protein